ncbi:MAG: single-stranded DNA-binding protein [Bacteriovoracaceae bacterium]|nr:single-stranded DNA-binding protein [Bacteriovoracaceae bacterium]
MKNHYAKIEITGVITKEVTRFVHEQSGNICLSSSIAINRIYFDENMQPRSKTTFIDWDYWLKSVSTLQINLNKGDHVLLKGELHEKTYHSKAENKEKRKHFLKVQSIEKPVE